MSKILSISIILLLLPCLNDALYNDKTNYEIPAKILQNMITQACANIEDQVSCLSNVESRLPNGPRNATSVLRAALESSLNEVQQAIRKVSDPSSLSFSTTSSSTASSSTTREQIAVEDCKELLDYSVTELSWSLSKMREIRARGSVHDAQGELQTWLSAAVSNQDTCLEGFDGTNQHVRNSIKGSLTQVTQLVSNVLTMYTQLHTLPFRPPRQHSYNNNNKNHTRKSKSDQNSFPKWMTEGDKNLMVSSSPSKGMHVDAVVSLDGSGKYRSISEAINDAPNHSNRRYVIYVKKGVYRENVDMKKKKTNIMLIGDGIGATVISSSRNFMQGWTTFRSATFGKFY